MKMLFKGTKSYSSMSMGDIGKSMDLMKEGTKEKKACGMNDFQTSEQFDVEPPKKGDQLTEMYSLAKSKDFLGGETCSTTCIASARGLARMGAYMANKGSLGGKQYISEETWDKMHADLKPDFADYHLFMNMSAGGLCKFGMDEEQKSKQKAFAKAMHSHMHDGREDFWGWIGHGGSIMQWHPETKVSVGYVPFDFLDTDYVNKRGKELQKIVIDIVKGRYQAPIKDKGCGFMCC